MSPRLVFDLRGEGPRVVLVHGFTQSSRSWANVAAALVAEHEVLALEAPNHGRSAGTTAVGLGEAARLVTDAGGYAAYVGYSMGGRICLRAALDHPSTFEKLVLVSATAGIEDGTERAARRGADEALAARLDPDPEATEPLAIDGFLTEWLAGPMFATLDRSVADLPSRLVNKGRGLARSLRTLGSGSMRPLWDSLHQIAMPVLIVAGELDPKFVAIGERLAASIGSNAKLRVVAEAGHSVPFERPDDFVALLGEFLTPRARS